jgi:phosphoenolpyruvate-protein phosphotransferase
MGERILRGVVAAPGVAVGKVTVLDRLGSLDVEKVPAAERKHQIERARGALQVAAAELEVIASGLRDAGRNDEASIVETGILMAADPGLLARVESMVNESGLPAPDAIRVAADEFGDELAGIEDTMLAQRADDVRSLGRRAAARAAGLKAGAAGGIVIASTLGPADVAEVSATGIVLAGGGVTAHAAIVARSLGLPMVVGMGPDVLAVRDGEEVVLDADQGVLVLQPDPARVAAARSEAERKVRARAEAVARRLEPASTKDGHRVTVLANASTVVEVLEALEQGAEGVGLIRTELPFLDVRAWPSFDQQASFLSLVLAPLSGRTATVRLFDFGGDKTPPFLRGTESRGIDLLLEARDHLRTQLAAIVEAGPKARLRILVPMITSPEQLRAVRSVLMGILEGRPCPQLGAMIETPEAAAHAREIATESDFLSLGTNDLTQMILGTDRETARSAPVTHPAVLRAIDATIRAGHQARIPVDVCGEAGSDALAMPVLVGLGVDELSVAAARVGDVRERIRQLEFPASEQAAKRLLLDQVADAAGEGV